MKEEEVRMGLGSWGEETHWKKKKNKTNTLSQGENRTHTISAEALGEGGGVGDVIGGVLLWHQGDHWAICYLNIKTHSASIQNLTLVVCSGLGLCGVLAHLVVSQCVEPFPVIVDLSRDIFILKNNPGHPALPPFLRKKKNRFRLKDTLGPFGGHCGSTVQNMLCLWIDLDFLYCSEFLS